ncbi:hypothetical protein ACQI4E_15770 [Streptomyces sp. CA-252508]|uniref:hypothetical protein n=1 Tax=Streptomyces sp. CA-252508 TaxID=3418946 RepID=UPI003D8AA1C3
MNLPLALAAAALRSPFKRPAPGAAPAGATAPGRRLTEAGVRIDPARLAAYARGCGFPGRGPVPLPYPHVLAFPAALRLMAARDFPLPLLGLVHTWIEVTQHRPLHTREPLDLTVRVAGLAPHRRGTEATVTTEAHVAGEPVWESRSGYLARHRAPGPAPHPRPRTRRPHTPPPRTPPPRRRRPRSPPAPSGASRPASDGTTPASPGTATRSTCTR